MTSVTRTIGRMAAVGAVALLLTGAVADSAAARRPSEMPAVVKGLVRGCYEMGGRATVWAEQISNGVTCQMPNSTVINCVVDIEASYPEAYCE